MNKCPRCGYVEGLSVKMQDNRMNEYVTVDGKTDGFYNKSDEKLVINGVTLYRKDVWVEMQAKKAAPVTPKTEPAKK